MRQTGEMNFGKIIILNGFMGGWPKGGRWAVAASGKWKHCEIFHSVN